VGLIPGSRLRDWGWLGRVAQQAIQLPQPGGGVSGAVDLNVALPNGRSPAKARDFRVEAGGPAGSGCGLARGQHPSLQLEGRRLQAVEIGCGEGVGMWLAELFPQLCSRLFHPSFSLSGFRDAQVQLRQRFGRELVPGLMIDGGTAVAAVADGDQP